VPCTAAAAFFLKKDGYEYEKFEYDKFGTAAHWTAPARANVIIRLTKKQKIIKIENIKKKPA
jgi:hypothetical protein